MLWILPELVCTNRILVDKRGKGKYGYGLQFTERSKGYIYYPSAGNIAYSKENWNGAISFWLSLDPATDLEPGFCDPIQITDVSYNDAAIWVDFTENNPRDFRLGVIGDEISGTQKDWKKRMSYFYHNSYQSTTLLLPKGNGRIFLLTFPD